MNLRRGWSPLRVALSAVAVLLLLAGCGGVPADDREPGSAQPEEPGATEAPRQPAGPLKDSVKPLEGYVAPDFTMTDAVSGEQFTLMDLRGQTVFVNFWATWCPPCKAEMPEMEELQQQAGEKVRIVAVDADPRESTAKMAQYAEAMGLTFTIAHAPEAAALYRVTGIPTSFFIDKHGVIRSRYTGAMTLELMQESIAKTEQAAAEAE